MAHMSKHDDPFLWLWFELTDERAKAEYALVQAIPCDPVAGIACAGVNGIGSSKILAREDLRIIFLANELAGKFGRRASFSLARRALQEAHYWTANHLHPNYRGADVWGQSTLVSFWDEFSPIPTPMQAMAIRDRARVLLDIDARQRDAKAHYRESLRILESSPLPEHLRTNSEVAA